MSAAIQTARTLYAEAPVWRFALWGAGVLTVVAGGLAAWPLLRPHSVIQSGASSYQSPFKAAPAAQPSPPPAPTPVNITPAPQQVTPAPPVAPRPPPPTVTPPPPAVAAPIPTPAQPQYAPAPPSLPVEARTTPQPQQREFPPSRSGPPMFGQPTVPTAPLLQEQPRYPTQAPAGSSAQPNERLGPDGLPPLPPGYLPARRPFDPPFNAAPQRSARDDRYVEDEGDDAWGPRPGTRRCVVTMNVDGQLRRRRVPC